MKSLNFRSIESDFFKGKNPLKKILAISLDLLGARQSGLLYGTNASHMRFLPSSTWDRGVMDRFDGRGLIGLILRFVGTYIVTARKLSPVFFYKTEADGQQRENDGIIAYVLRNCADYYKQGINVVICPGTDRFLKDGEDRGGYHHIPFYIYDGTWISKPKTHIKVDTRIVKQFKSTNSIYIILPDYGIMVINTADEALLELQGDTFVREDDLRQRLDVLIRLVETSSLAYLGQLTGRKSADLLWRKEEHLRKAYADLADNERKYRDLYENAPNAYFSMDADGVISQCNRQAEHLSGFFRKDLTGKTAYHLFGDQQDADGKFKGIWETLINGVPVKDLELRMTRKDGNSHWVSLSIDAIRGKDGRIREMRAMALDISKRKTLEKQLFHAQKMEAIGNLARGIAHDFNNVLSPVSGYAQMLLMDEDRDEQEKERIQIILDCTRHAKDLVNQILTFSRQKEHQFMLIKAADAVEDSMALVRSFLPATIKINTVINPDCGYIMADPIQLHQVIMNLITNSFHAMETGGTLEVTMSRQSICPGHPDTEGMTTGAYVRLAISDTGDGIDDAVLPKIFEPYFTTKEDGKGSGIGLSVVHGIVQGHGGDIRVFSTKGQGTRFNVYFPVCKKHGQEYEGQSEADELVIVEGTESILLVDDDVKVAFMLTRILERLGYTVTCFTVSADALEAYAASPQSFDLVITDYTMPDMDGFELAREICAVDPDQPILLCTGLGDHIDTRQDTGQCVAGFLSKPVEIKQLSALIRKNLDSPVRDQPVIEQVNS